MYVYFIDIITQLYVYRLFKYTGEGKKNTESVVTESGWPITFSGSGGDSASGSDNSRHDRSSMFIQNTHCTDGESNNFSNTYQISVQKWFADNESP